MKVLEILVFSFLMISCFSKSKISIASFNPKEVVNVKDFGAKGNGFDDDTKAFQSALDYLYHSEKYRLFIPKGIFILNSVVIYPGITIYGEEGTILKKKSYAGKWSRMFTTITSKLSHNAVEDSEPIVFHDLQFDGNFQNQGAYKNHQLQQQHLIFLSAKQTSQGRLKAEIYNCKFKNSVADAISIYANTDVKIKNCVAENVFRGGIVITGGNAKVHVEGFKAIGNILKTGIDVEIDGVGYQGSKSADIFMKNIELAGDFDMSLSSGRFIGDSIICHDSPFNLYGLNSEIRISNSKFNLSGKYNNRIYYPMDVVFNNTQFYLRDEPRTKLQGILNIYNRTNYHSCTNNKLRFIDCQFINKGIKSNTYAIKINPDSHEKNNLCKIVNSRIENFETAIILKQGGCLEVFGSEVNTTVGVRATATRNYKYDINISKSDFSKVDKPIFHSTYTKGSKLKIKTTKLADRL